MEAPHILMLSFSNLADNGTFLKFNLKASSTLVDLQAIITNISTNDTMSFP